MFFISGGGYLFIHPSIHPSIYQTHSPKMAEPRLPSLCSTEAFQLFDILPGGFFPNYSVYCIVFVLLSSFRRRRRRRRRFLLCVRLSPYSLSFFCAVDGRACELCFFMTSVGLCVIAACELWCARSRKVYGPMRLG